MRRITVVLAIGIVAMSELSAALAQIDPSFEDSGLADWNPRGNVLVMPHDLSYAPSGSFALFQEPGTGGISQIWQPFTIPPQPGYFAFRYNFQYGASTSKPVLVTAVSRKTHAGLGTVDIDVLTGDTECRSATLSESTTQLLVVATFDKNIGRLNLSSGDITTDTGTITGLTVTNKVATFTVTEVPHAAQIKIQFPGVVDAVFRREDGASEAFLCIGVVTGDYNNDAHYDGADISDVTPFVGTAATTQNARADWNLDGQINTIDRDDSAALLNNGPTLFCPQSFAGNLPPKATTDPAIPPDSFMAFLIDPITNLRLTGLNLSAPDFGTAAFLYHDSDGTLLFDPTKVTVSPSADTDGLRSVVLNLASVAPNASARIAFALVSANNGIVSTAALDTVYTACPSAELCCTPQGAGQALDDGLVCTVDTCVNGVPTHTPSTCCGECIDSPSDVVIMIDQTGSVGTSLANEREAAKDFLRRFQLGSPRPRVAIGSFHAPQPPLPNYPDARIWAPLTHDYGVETPTPTGLFAEIDRINWAVGLTDIGIALNVAMNELPASEQSASYIVLISDGLPNWPVTQDCVTCSCPTDQQFGENAANMAKARGIDIIAVHSPGQSDVACVPGAIAYMRDRIATQAPGFFYQNVAPGNLPCTFATIATLVACDDEVKCTIDACNQGICTHTVDPSCQP